MDGGHFNLSDVRSQLEFYLNAPAPPLVVTLPEMGYRPVLSPDGRLLASVIQGTVISLWDTTTGQNISSLSKHEQPVVAMTFSPDGKSLASVDMVGMIVLWNVATQEQIHIFTLPQTWRYSLAFSPNSRFFASSAEGLVSLWDVTTGAQTGQFEALFGVSNLAFSPDGKYLAAADLSSVHLWDISAGQEEQLQIENTSSLISKVPVIYSLDGQKLIYAACSQTDGQVSNCLASEILLWDIGKRQLFTSFGGPTAEVTEMAISPDGILLAASFCFQTGSSGCSGSQVLIWNLATLKRFYEFNIEGGIKDLVFSVEGRTLIASSDNNTISFWDISWIK